jgi:hypothetical protein
VSGTGTTPKALDLVGSVSSASEDEVVAPVHAPRRKCPQKSLPKTAQKSSDVLPAKGTSIRRRSIRLFYVRYI